jgi:four helix bundle protein
MRASVTPDELRVRTKVLALNVIRLVEGLPRSRAADVVGRQLLRAGTSVAANDRSACRARSRREFLAKMGIVEEEADETSFWLEIVSDSRWATRVDVSPVRQEASQLVAIAVASIRTARWARRRSGALPSNPQSAIRNAQSSTPQCS